MAYGRDILSILNPGEDTNLAPELGSKESIDILNPKHWVTADEQAQKDKQAADLAAAHKMFFADQEQERLKTPIGEKYTPTPQWQMDKAKAILDKETAAAVAPLENFYNYQAASGPVLPISANASPTQKAIQSTLSTKIAEEYSVAQPGSSEATQQAIDKLTRYTDVESGKSYRMLQDLGIEYPGTGRSAPVFQSDAPAKGVLIGKAVQPALPVDNTGLEPVVASEFGEIDRPSRGGYTEAGWNVGAWGDSLEGKESKLAALPISTLKKYGNPNSPGFQKSFNSQYEIQAVGPNGQAVSMSLGDKGPGASTGAGLDMTWGARAALGLEQNFKGQIHYRIVKKGSALPDGTTSTAASSPTTAAPGTPESNITYIEPIDRKKLRDPEIYGERNSPEDNALWARHLSDIYATEMAKAGTPITEEKYQDQFKTYMGATVAKVKGEAPKEIPAADSDRFRSLAGSVPQLDDLLAAKLAVPGGIFGVGFGDKQAVFYSRLKLLGPNVSKGIGGQTGAPSDTDIKNAESVLPTEHDSETASKDKIAAVKEATRRQMELIIQQRRAEHYNTDWMEQEYKRLYPNIAASQVASDWQQRGDKFNKNAPGPSAPTPTPGRQQPQQPEKPNINLSLTARKPYGS